MRKLQSQNVVLQLAGDDGVRVVLCTKKYAIVY